MLKKRKPIADALLLTMMLAAVGRTGAGTDKHEDHKDHG